MCVALKGQRALGKQRMRAVSRRSHRKWALAALSIGGPAWAMAGTEPAPFPSEPAQLAKAEALRTLPCLAGGVDRASPAAEGFTAEPGLEPAWRVAGTVVAVRRAGADRFRVRLGAAPDRQRRLRCAAGRGPASPGHDHAMCTPGCFIERHRRAYAIRFRPPRHGLLGGRAEWSAASAAHRRFGDRSRHWGSHLFAARVSASAKCIFQSEASDLL